MSFDRYQLQALLGEGADGASFRAVDRADGLEVEVRTLSGARADANRWQGLTPRLRLAAVLDHPATVLMRELGLESEPPYVALQWVEQESLALQLQAQVPLPVPQALSLVRALAAALAAAHRLGLVHGKLVPSILRLNEQQPKIDFTGTILPVSPTAESFRELDASCQAPEQVQDGTPSFAADIYGLGALLIWLLSGQPVAASTNGQETRHSQAAALTALGKLKKAAAEGLKELLQGMLATDPDDRPSALAVEVRLTALLSGSEAAITPHLDQLGSLGAPNLTADHVSRQSLVLPGPRESLGRFRLLEKLGQGGMGAVYRALDLSDGATVAIKLIRADLADDPKALRRFHKEARLLAEVNNPFVARLLEVNQDDGIHYLAIEFVAGQNVRQLVAERGRLEEPTALAIMADVARALQAAHERGIIHRDVKPDNIVLVGESSELSPGSSSPPSPQPFPRVKLLDFGLARSILQSDSQHLTEAGVPVGTPLYMSPEQADAKGVIDPRTDVYAMGATLFHLLAGRPPFQGKDAVGTLVMHRNEPVPSLKQINPAVSDAVCQIVEKALAKSPGGRYASAGAMLQDLERVRRGEPTSIAIHPKLPACAPGRLLNYEWAWDLESSPAQLWPHISNTERLNRAIGLPAVEYTTRAEPGGPSALPGRVRRFGEFRKAGLSLAWEENPFEWVEGRRMGVLRQYTRGPLKWLASVVELTPRSGGGTRLTHQIRVEPRGLLGRIVAAIELGFKARRALDRVYRRIDAALAGQRGSQPLADPFELPVELSGKGRRRLDHLLNQLAGHNIDAAIIESLRDFLANAPAQEAARIRPLALARRLALDPDQFVDACLHGSREGLLVLLWDILCPVCRIPTDVKDSLRQLQDHARCEACNLDFKLDFANSVEMTFRVSPEIRPTERGTYCIGGPAHSPHVAAQVRLGPGEHIDLDLALGEGAYRLRGPQLPFSIDFRIQPQARAQRWDLNLAQGPAPELPRTLQSGAQVLALTNDHDQELIVRIERTAPRTDALTAARASSLALFRAFFPSEILAPGQLIGLATVTLLVTELDEADSLYAELGDVGACGLVHEHFRLLEDQVRGDNGIVVKSVNESLLTAFDDTVAAVRTALELQPLLGKTVATKALRLRVGVHRGPAMITTLNDHLDYFGSTVKRAMELPRLAQGCEVVISQDVAADPQVAALLRSRQLQHEVLPSGLPEQPGLLVYRLVRPLPANDRKDATPNPGPQEALTK